MRIHRPWVAKSNANPSSAKDTSATRASRDDLCTASSLTRSVGCLVLSRTARDVTFPFGERRKDRGAHQLIVVNPNAVVTLECQALSAISGDSLPVPESDMGRAAAQAGSTRPRPRCCVLRCVAALVVRLRPQNNSKVMGVRITCIPFDRRAISFGAHHQRKLNAANH